MKEANLRFAGSRWQVASQLAQLHLQPATCHLLPYFIGMDAGLLVVALISEH
jgi:hypothetical protein